MQREFTMPARPSPQRGSVLRRPFQHIFQHPFQQRVSYHLPPKQRIQVRLLPRAFPGRYTKGALLILAEASPPEARFDPEVNPDPATNEATRLS